MSIKRIRIDYDRVRPVGRLICVAYRGRIIYERQEARDERDDGAACAGAGAHGARRQTCRGPAATNCE